MGAPPLEGPPSLEEPQKSAFRPAVRPPSHQSAPAPLEPGPNVPGHAQQGVQEGPLCGPELRLPPPSIYLPHPVSPTRGGSLAHGRLPRWGGQGHPRGQSEEGGELPPGTLRGEAPSPSQARLSPQHPKREPLTLCPQLPSPQDGVSFRGEHRTSGFRDGL